MTEKSYRDWTQYDIVEETERRHSGYGVFDELASVSETAFEGKVVDADESGQWEWDEDVDNADPPSNWFEFSMGELSVGQLVDFFGERGHNAVPLKWHNESGGPSAYVVIDDRILAAEFRNRFDVDWSDKDELKKRRDEDAYRAGQ